ARKAGEGSRKAFVFRRKQAGRLAARKTSCSLENSVASRNRPRRAVPTGAPEGVVPSSTEAINRALPMKSRLTNREVFHLSTPRPPEKRKARRMGRAFRNATERPARRSVDRALGGMRCAEGTTG